MTDLETYQSLQDGTREYLKDDYGMTTATFGTKTVLVISGSEGWCGECACSEGCCGYGDTVWEVRNLRITEPADENGEQEEVEFDEGERLCERCGESIYHDDYRDAVEAAREAADEMAWEARREEGW